MSLTETIFDSKPTTIKDALIKMLVTNGLWAKQAQAVFARFRASEVAEPMAERWDDAPEGYPGPTLAVLCMGIRQEALKYIDDTCPNHWSRGMFVDNKDN